MEEGPGGSGPGGLCESSWGQVSCPLGPSEVWGPGLPCKRGFLTPAWPAGHTPGDVEGSSPEARRPGKRGGVRKRGAEKRGQQSRRGEKRRNGG